ncbi:O-antigen ligase family protein [Salisediminibacterium halotolerans]|nr:O-antigen ligase family protein [Salisediminibacterium halotolerans]
MLNTNVFNYEVFMGIRYIGVVIISIIFVFIYLKLFTTDNNRLIVPYKNVNIGVLLIWLTFSSGIFFSQVINQEFPFQGVYFLIVVPLLFFLMIPLTISEIANKIIAMALLLSGGIFLIFSFLFEPINFDRSYFGITDNSNSLGYLATQTGIAAFCLLLNAFKNRKKILVYLFILIFLLSTFFVFLSHSRTSFIVLLVTCFSTMLIFMLQNNIKLRNLFLPALIFIGVYYWQLRDLLMDGVISKFDRLGEEGDLLNTRDEIWLQIINDANLIGNGSDYFDETPFSPHSSIFSIIGEFGIISGLLLVVMYVTTIYLSLKFAIQRKDESFSYLPFSIILAFILFSFTEGMFGTVGKGLTLAYFNSIGVCIFLNKSMHNKKISRNTDFHDHQ